MQDQKVRILVADDEEPIRLICDRYLTRLGYEVDLVENGQESLNSLIHNDYDLVLTDYSMPDIDGMQLIEQIRESKPHTAVVMMTGFGTIELAVKAMKNGADDFVIKPLDFDQLSLTIERVLKNRELSDEVRRLRTVNKQLEELEKTKDKFIDITGHELRTPVSNILTFAELMLEQEGELSPEDNRQFLSVISDSACRLKRIVDDMHSSFFEAELNAKLNIEPFQVEDFLEELMQEFEEIAKKRSLQLSLHFPKETGQWEGDRLKLQRAVRELIENAVKYTPDNGRIEIRCDHTEDRMTIHVVDDGIGISDKDKFKIFDKFFEAQDSRHHSTSDSEFMGAGTGLGLTVAKSIVEAHGGRITVQSTPNNGSNFTVEIPKEAAEVD